MEHLGVWCQGGKTSRMILGEIVASWQSGKGLRPSANNLKPIILHWERFISGKCNFSFQVYLYISSLPQHLSWGILHCEVKMLQYKRKTSKRKNSTLTGRNLQQKLVQDEIKSIHCCLVIIISNMKRLLRWELKTTSRTLRKSSYLAFQAP